MSFGYWNINARPFVAPLLDPSTAPTIDPGKNVAISGDVIAFVGSTGNLEYVTVPMKGDANQDGKVDIPDLVISAACFGQILTGSAC